MGRILVGGCLTWQLLRQNGRLLLRLEELEKRLDKFGAHQKRGQASISILRYVFTL
jgi:hypothetical protein